jgi:hypothetical protein
VLICLCVENVMLRMEYGWMDVCVPLTANMQVSEDSDANTCCWCILQLWLLMHTQSTEVVLAWIPAIVARSRISNM